MKVWTGLCKRCERDEPLELIVNPVVVQDREGPFAFPDFAYERGWDGKWLGEK